MKQKHIQIRIEQCLSLAKASGCSRRKLGALLLDPKRNVVLMDGYNGGPRGGVGNLCGGHFCQRDGLKPEMFKIHPGFRHGPRHTSERVVRVFINDEPVKVIPRTSTEGLPLGPDETPLPTAEEKAEEWVQEMLDKYPGVKSGTHMEVGCHHAEMNVICNAAAIGVSCSGAWLICLAEPCMMCAKMIHHAGITKVIVVDGGYLGGKDGLDYLRSHNIQVSEVEGPKDPRLGT